MTVAFKLMSKAAEGAEIWKKADAIITAMRDIEDEDEFDWLKTDFRRAAIQAGDLGFKRAAVSY